MIGDELAPFFPGGQGQVLVTSRNPVWSRVAEPMQIDVFSRAESLEYLQRQVTSLSRSDAGMVAEMLGDLPLAIEHASAWLAETAMSATVYVSQLEAQSSAAESLSEPFDYPLSVAVTWRLSFDRLRKRSPAAARLLELCAYFAPDPISLSLLYSDEMVGALLSLEPRLRERAVLGQLIRDIARYSLAKVDRGSNSIQVHRLIQVAIRGQMESRKYREDAMHEVHRILVGARPRQGDIDDPENWARYDLIWPHLGPSEAYRCDSPDTRHLLIDRVRDLREVGDYAWSIELLRDTHRRYRTVLGEDFLDTLRTAKNLAVSLRKMGRYDEAYELSKDASDRLERNYGVNHPEALACRLNLACDLSARGDKAAAYTLARKGLLAYQDAMGARHPFTLAAASNIATYLRGRGSVEDALALAQRTLSALGGALSEDHPFTLSCAVNKANCLLDDGQLSAAEGLLRETLARLKKTLRDQHPDTLICEGNLAIALHTQGRADDAVLLQRQVIAAMERVLGEDHPSIGALRGWRPRDRDLEVQPT
jgi:tetratricopeptide (TPR) repeat protein